ncbi:uncharacterized protein TNCV_1269811 [Trichonephila clavipes]|nr:uncharacterized protein TNCV_1269811 [Trichonephila clavipes]
MITNFFIPELNNHDVQELWFQQDGATCHTSRATIDLLKDTFGDRLISRFGPVNCPPRSCDLTPLDYFLWVASENEIISNQSISITISHFDSLITRSQKQLVAAVAEWYRYRTVVCLVRSSNPVPLKTRRVGQRCTLNLSRAETSSRWFGVVVRRGGAISGVIHVT